MIQQATKGVLFLRQAKAIKDPEAIHPLFTLAGFVAWGKGAGKGVRSLLSDKIVTGVKTMRCLTMKFAIRGWKPRLRIMHPLREKAFRNHRQNHVSEDRK